MRGQAIGFSKMSVDLLADVEVSECSDLVSTNAKVLLKMEANLKSDDKNVALPRPISIRPGLFYKICIGPLPDGHGFYSEVLMTEMQTRSNVSIKLHNCDTVQSPANFSRYGKPIRLTWAFQQKSKYLNTIKDNHKSGK